LISAAFAGGGLFAARPMPRAFVRARRRLVSSIRFAAGMRLIAIMKIKKKKMMTMEPKDVIFMLRSKV
jgi:hypothetical protein